MGEVIEIHFVCRDDANVMDRGDGTFETGFWVVAAKHAGTVRRIALHQSKSRPSYRHGTVTGWHTVEWEGRERVVFTVRQEGPSLGWVGAGTGERGYRRS